MSPVEQKADRHVGERVRELRGIKGVTQAQLAFELGIKYQQLWKNELGKNRISAGRLYHISRILGADPSWFYEGIDDDKPARDTQIPPDASALVRAFSRIPTANSRRAVFNLAKSLGPI